MDNLLQIKGTSSLLGESPLYLKEKNSLYWSDIKGLKLCKLDISSGKVENYFFNKEIGSFTFTEDLKVIACTNDGYEYLNLDTLTTEPIIDPESNLKDNRFNDGKCDKYGRYFAGTMDNTEKSINGSLYCYDGQNISQKVTNLGISNGLGWNKEYTKFYLCDSMKGIIYEYNYDLQTGTLSDKKVFVDVDEKDGYPDGLCIDIEGCIYSCHWDGARITKYSPNAEILEVVKLPVPRVTSCCFGGKNLDKLYITTAAFGLDKNQIDQYPLSGYIFTLDTKTKGLENNFFKG